MNLVQGEEKATVNSIRTMAMQSGECRDSLAWETNQGQIFSVIPTYVGVWLYATHAASYYFLLRTEKEIQTK